MWHSALSAIEKGAKDLIETVLSATDQDHTDSEDQRDNPTPQREEIPLDVTWYGALFATEKNTKSIIANHLNDYTKRNTFDYFIHKNLGEFLRRELDFYVKNEMLRLDDGDDNRADGADIDLSITLTRIKAFRSVGHKIITFLAQLEDFQKKLWLKKKFVVATDYCVTLDHVPEELYPTIIANNAQVDEWVKLFAIDELHGNMFKHAYSRPLTIEFLKEHKYLVVDTKFFNQAFKDILLTSIDNIDETCNGLLIHSENFQALNMLQTQYREKVKCIYIDPPYNTKGDGFIYKDHFQHSSWLSFLHSRNEIAKSFLSDDGVIGISIDDNEFHNLTLLQDNIFGDNKIGELVVIRAEGGGLAKKIVKGHDYFTIYAKNIEKCPPLLRPKEIRGKIVDIHGKKYWIETDWLRVEFGKYGTLLYEDIAQVKGLEKKKEIDEGINNGIYCLIPKDDKHIVGRFRDVEEDGSKFYSVIKYLNSDGSQIVNDLFGPNQFPYPKPVELVSQFVLGSTFSSHSYNNATVLDYFAGSGTTAHSVISINRNYSRNLRYVMIEAGNHFNTVTKPRIQKVIYSADWKDGKPVNRAGSSHMFKYLRLESYEDTLNNVQMQVSETRKQLFAENSNSPMHEEYILGYMLDVESRDSASLLNQQAFTHPFDYRLNIAKSGSVAESVPTRVDMVETFNYLIGLRVQRMRTDMHLRLVTGTTPDGRRTLVVWRDGALLGDQNHFWMALTANELGAQLAQDYDVIYVNGDTTLASYLPSTCQVRLIDTEFHARMFADTAY